MLSMLCVDQPLLIIIISEAYINFLHEFNKQEQLISPLKLFLNKVERVGADVEWSSRFITSK